MILYLAGTTPSPQKTIDSGVFEEGFSRLHSYLNESQCVDTLIANRILEKGGYPCYMDRKELDNLRLFFSSSGEGFSVFKNHKLYNLDILLSYGIARKYVDDYISLCKQAESEDVKEGDANMDLFLAGDSSGFPEATPEKRITESNVLLSYEHPRGKFSADATIEAKKREENMDLFLVGPEKDNIMSVAIEEQRSNILFNYIDGKKATDTYQERIKPRKLFIDSGAFSAWTKGKVINVDEYIEWINARADYIDLYGQIDVIPGDIIKGHTPEQVREAAKATWENYLYMRPRMKKPEGLLYTFHVGEPFEYLKQALEWTDEEGKHIPYIALGGMVGKPMPVKEAFLNSCFEIIRKSSNPQVKVHAFGMTSFDLLERYPITSADSTSWIMTGATGGIMTDKGTIAVSSQQVNDPNHYSHLPAAAIEEFNKSIAEFGFTLQELADSRDNRIMFNARYMNKRANNLVQKCGPIKKSLF